MSEPTFIFYVLRNNFVYILLAFVVHLQKDFYSVQAHTDAFYLFLLQKNFDIFRGPYFVFHFILLLKEFVTFDVPLFEVFLCLFDNIRLAHLYRHKCAKRILTLKFNFKILIAFYLVLKITH